MKFQRELYGKHQLNYIQKVVLYATPEGELATRLGNMRVSISADEARDLLEDLINRASQPDKNL